MMQKGLGLVKILVSGILCAPTGAIADLFPPHPLLYAHDRSGMPHQDETHHRHSMVEVPPGQPVPTVRLIVHLDAMKGWNLELQTTNFTFAPERVNTRGNFREGHAHLYIDGKKITRLYGNWYYLGVLPPGEHKIRVTLNTNAHETLVYNGRPIQATATIQVKEVP
ncbi:hypothetical protein [Leptothermofonsia sp. ETS-13]|uniref:hypothetical protein n=1 Tax=Leptothermofonsia sp. ETS-13 TaxID=3035696 RepID=UPI003B9EBDA7